MLSGVTEEVIVRGVVYRILEEWFGTWAALAVSSLLFGALHLGNPGATWWSSLAIALEAGTLLGAAYLKTRRLWLPIGVHAAWNYTQAACGVAVSGNAVSGFLLSHPKGADWLSGGPFGAEASVLAVLVCGTGAAVLIVRSVREGRVLAPAWRRAQAGTAA
jgi:membrane protease YdiL (CAAX protease family)